MIAAGPLEGMMYRLLAWDMKEISFVTFGKALAVPADKTIFVTEMTR